MILIKRILEFRKRIIIKIVFQIKRIPLITKTNICLIRSIHYSIQKEIVKLQLIY